MLVGASHLQPASWWQSSTRGAFSVRCAMTQGWLHQTQHCRAPRPLAAGPTSLVSGGRSAFGDQPDGVAQQPCASQSFSFCTLRNHALSNFCLTNSRGRSV